MDRFVRRVKLNRTEHTGVADRAGGCDVVEDVALLRIDVGNVLHMRVSRQHERHAHVRKLIAPLLGIVHHVVFADDAVNRRGGDHRVMRHGDNKLTVFLRVGNLCGDPFEALIRKAASAVAVAVVIERKKTVAVAKLNNIGHTFLMDGDGFIGTEAAV